MKKTLLALFLLSLLTAPLSAAQADTNIYMRSHSGRVHHSERYRGRHWTHARFVQPYLYAPPARTIIYQPAPITIVRPTYVAEVQPVTNIGLNTGLTCREYQSTATVGGSYAPVYGTACLQQDGSWRIVD